MAEPGLAGKRLLVVEDEYLVAVELVDLLKAAGAEVVGPAGTLEDALDLVERTGHRLDGAVLDINLRDKRVYPVADALSACGVPFVFATGYDLSTVPESYAAVPRCGKPVDQEQLMRLLTSG